MIIYGDYHTHTTASDGHSSIEDNVRAAKSLGLEQLVISDHSFSSIIHHMTRTKFDEQEREIANINAHGGVRLLHGIEANIFADGSLDVPDDIIRRVNVLNVGFHRLIQFGWQKGSAKFINVNGYMSERERGKMKEYNTAAYLRAIQKYPIDTLCHLNHRAMVDVRAVCTAAKEMNVYIELNEKHLNTLKEDIDVAIDCGVNFIVGSDAHRAKKVGCFVGIEEFIAKHGVPQERVYGINGNVPNFKDKRSWYGE